VLGVSLSQSAMAKQRPSLRKGFPDRRRRVKRRAYAIKFHRRSLDLVAIYRDLIRATEEVCAAAHDVANRVARVEALAALREELLQVLPLVERVIDQSRRRVLESEKVPADEKIVSIFEPHTDILVKDNRTTYYGHKICLTGKKSSPILDCVAEEGNPTDSSLVERTLVRHIERFGKVPRQVAMDGGFASKNNLATAKELRVEDMAFNKKRGLEIHEMARGAWVFRRLRDFRSGIEGVISTLKRAFQLSRCAWRGLDSSKAYVLACVTQLQPYRARAPPAPTRVRLTPFGSQRPKPDVRSHAYFRPVAAPPATCASSRSLLFRFRSQGFRPGDAQKRRFPDGK
jgi:IS5 family transposase